MLHVPIDAFLSNSGLVVGRGGEGGMDLRWEMVPRMMKNREVVVSII